MYVLQKMLPASMLPTPRDTVILLYDTFSVSLKFQWAVLVIAIDKLLSPSRAAERSGVRFCRLDCLRSVVIEARATFSAGKGAVELDAICQPGD